MLEKKIAAGMSFTCPAHWCSKCGKMEDSAKIAQWLAVCRRCPVSYHKKCLPRCSVFLNLVAYSLYSLCDFLILITSNGLPQRHFL
jgi:hypothetical protein